MVLLISKHLRGYFWGNTPYSSVYRAWLFGLNPFHSKGFHLAANPSILEIARSSLRHTLLAAFVVHPVKAS